MSMYVSREATDMVRLQALRGYRHCEATPIKPLPLCSEQMRSRLVNGLIESYEVIINGNQLTAQKTCRAKTVGIHL